MMYNHLFYNKKTSKLDVANYYNMSTCIILSPDCHVHLVKERQPNHFPSLRSYHCSHRQNTLNQYVMHDAQQAYTKKNKHDPEPES